MREGPEALVGGPPLSLSESLAFSAFRLRPLGRDATPAPLEMCSLPSPCSLALLTPHLPSKGLSAAAQSTVVLPQWWLSQHSGEVVKYRRKRSEGVLWGPAF